MLITSLSELAPDQTAELMFSQKGKQAPSSDRIGPQETELHDSAHGHHKNVFTEKEIVSYFILTCTG